MPENANFQVLTELEVITQYPISRTTLWKAREEGRLSYCRVGRKIVYLPEHLEAFFKGCELVAKRRPKRPKPFPSR
jgi:hypothetical protein